MRVAVNDKVNLCIDVLEDVCLNHLERSAAVNRDALEQRTHHFFRDVSLPLGSIREKSLVPRSLIRRCTAARITERLGEELRVEERPQGALRRNDCVLLLEVYGYPAGEGVRNTPRTVVPRSRSDLTEREVSFCDDVLVFARIYF